MKDLTPYSRAAKHENCALFEESMKFSPELVHGIRFHFRCGGKLELTSEVVERSLTSN